MLYVIAILLLILVLSNDAARELLCSLMICAVKLAVAGGILFVIVMIGAWLFTSDRSKDVPSPSVTTVPPVTVSPHGLGEDVVAGIIIIGLIAVLIYDQYRLRKK